MDAFRSVEKHVRRSVTELAEFESKRSRNKKRTQPHLDIEWAKLYLTESKDPDALAISCVDNFIAMGLRPEATIWTHLDYPSGFYIIRNALSLESQLFWAYTSTKVYSKASHTNLTNLVTSKLKVPTSPSNSMAAIPDTETDTGDLDVAAELNDLQQLWENSLTHLPKFQTFKRLRWASLGYHYDWTSRMYKQDAKSPFPTDLSYLCKTLAGLAGLTIEPEAAIVNYYPISSQMCGHLDDAEHCMTEPIVSISIGCSAIFLLGGRTKDVRPVAVYLRSGDVMIMSGESRYAYHGVPAIIPKELEKYFADSADMSSPKVDPIAQSVVPSIVSVTGTHTQCDDDESNSKYREASGWMSSKQVRLSTDDRISNDSSVDDSQNNSFLSTPNAHIMKTLLAAGSGRENLQRIVSNHPKELSQLQSQTVPFVSSDGRSGTASPSVSPAQTEIAADVGVSCSTDVAFSSIGTSSSSLSGGISSSSSSSSSSALNDLAFTPPTDNNFAKAGSSFHSVRGVIGVPDDELAAVKEFLQQGRININVRRVTAPGATKWQDKCGSGYVAPTAES